ncbi:MAG: hypothetical protein H6711_24960 [Myxococcales bacterium]|nr:hypothetical protein [Myxococcales bacterium]
MRTSTPLLLLALLPACGLAALGDYHDALDARESEGGSSSGGTGSVGSASVTITATSPTGADSEGSSSSTTGEPEAPGTTGSTPAGPPTINHVEVGPSPIHQNGPIHIEVAADEADGVRMTLESGEERELMASGEGIFVGEIAALTGLDNGEHALTLIPWRADEEGEPAEATYAIALPKPGSEGFWETDVGEGGFVAAMGVLPSGDLLELGTRYVDDDPRCYLRRRDKSGAWWDADVVTLLGGQTCAALDLQVAADGTTYLLLLRYDNGAPRWWLGELATWGEPIKNLRLGSQGEEAAALALHDDGVAVCGSAPTVGIDGKDAAAWLYRPGQNPMSWSFDYQGANEEHMFRETVRDCAFAGDELVMVGEVFGYHQDDKNVPWDRHFIYRFNPLTKGEKWLVASPSLGMQSGATAVAVDDVGRVLSAGYRCNEPCEPTGMLEVHDIEGLTWHADIGTWPTKGYAARELLWSPAGYALLASGGPLGSEAAFVVRAYAPLKQTTPLWSYVREDANAVHMALTLAIGSFGEIWAGGFGATGYPAVAQIAG